MNLLTSMLFSHILSLLEQELTNNEPEIVAVIIKEVQVVIAKLEALLASKSPKAAQVLDPILNETQNLTVTAINAGASAAMAAAEG